MADITITAGEILNYTGSETAPLIRYFSSRTFVAANGDTVPSGNPEEGDFFQSVTCSVAGTTITVPQHIIPSTEDGTPNRAKYTVALFPAAGGEPIQVLFNGLIVPALPSPTDWEAIVAYTNEPDEDPIELEPNGIEGVNISKITVSASAPDSPVNGDGWIQTS